MSSNILCGYRVITGNFVCASPRAAFCLFEFAEGVVEAAGAKSGAHAYWG